MTEELEKICKDIQRLVPPATPREPTGPFLEFIERLQNTKTVPESDIESIKRAYNYFNCLVSASLSMPIQPQKDSVATKDETSTGSDKTKDLSKKPDPKAEAKPDVKAETKADTKAETKADTKAIPEENQKEMISILLKLGS